MAIGPLVDAVVTINSVDLSDHISSITLPEEAVELDKTNFGSSGRKEVVGGITSWRAEIQWQQDMDASEVEATLSGVGIGQTTTITVKADDAATSATNPQWSGTVLLTELPHVSGRVGDLHGFSTRWPGSGQLTKATS